MPQRVSPANRLLLVVDDEPLICWALKEHLLATGYEVRAVPDAAAALANFDDGAGIVDLVLLDLKLPDMDGLSLYRRIKRLDSSCQAILMTAFGTPDEIAEAHRLGISRVLNKPFNLDDIVAAVSDVLALRPSAPVDEQR